MLKRYPGDLGILPWFVSAAVIDVIGPWTA
jgi:hypothetical protein